MEYPAVQVVKRIREPPYIKKPSQKPKYGQICAI